METRKKTDETAGKVGDDARVPLVNDATEAPSPSRPKPDWAYWACIPEVDLEEAVALSCDVDPAAVKDPDGFGGTDLIDYEQRLDVARRNAGARGGFRVKRNPDGRITNINVAEFATWAVNMGGRSPYWATLPSAFAALAPEKPVLAWPWGTYETELLGHLAAAVKTFWTRYDPTKPQTAPTNEKVKKWLKDHGVTAVRTRDVMATIIRAANAPRGPRPRTNSKRE